MFDRNFVLKLLVTTAFALSACAKRSDTPPPDSNKKVPAQTKSTPPEEDGMPLPDGTQATPPAPPAVTVIPQETSPTATPSPASPSFKGEVVVTPTNKSGVPEAAKPETANAPKQESNFVMGALQKVGGVLGSLIPFSKPQVEPRASDDDEVAARRAQAKVATSELAKIPTLPTDPAVVSPAIDPGTVVGPKLVSMLAAADTVKAIEVDKVLVTDIFSDGTGKNNLDIQKAVGNLHTNGVYKGDAQERVRILEAMIDNRIFASQKGVSWLKDGTATALIAAFFASGVQVRQANALSRAMASGERITAGVEFQLAGTKNFQLKSSGEVHDSIIKMAANTGVPREALSQLQLVEGQGDLFALVPPGTVFEQTICPTLEIAVVDRTTKEHLGELRAIVLKYNSSLERAGNNNILYSQPLTAEKAAEVQKAFVEHPGLFSGRMASETPSSTTFGSDGILEAGDRIPEIYDHASLPESELPLHEFAKSLAKPRDSSWTAVGGNRRFARNFLIFSIPSAIAVGTASSIEHGPTFDTDEYYLESLIPKETPAQP